MQIIVPHTAHNSSCLLVGHDDDDVWLLPGGGCRLRNRGGGGIGGRRYGGKNRRQSGSVQVGHKRFQVPGGPGSGSRARRPRSRRVGGRPQRRNRRSGRFFSMANLGKSARPGPGVCPQNPGSCAKLFRFCRIESQICPKTPPQAPPEAEIRQMRHPVAQI